jgi:hypothetical protein
MKQPIRKSRIIPIGGSFALVTILVASAISYWQYINRVQPYEPHLEPGPAVNGYLLAVSSVTQLDQSVSPPDAARFPGYSPPTAPPPAPGWPEGEPAEVRARIAWMRPVLTRIRALYRCQWESTPSVRHPSLHVPFSGFRECARGFAAESFLARKKGDYSAAMGSALDGMELGCRLSHGGPVLHSLVAQAVHAIGYSQAERLALLLPARGLARDLERVRRLRREWPPLAGTLENERIFSLVSASEQFTQLQEKSVREQWNTLRADPLDTDQPASDTLRLMLSPRQAVLAHIDTYYRRVIAESRKPVRQRQPVQPPQDPWAESYSGFDSFSFTWMLERARTDLAILEVALAVRMHYLEHGSYPSTLSQISKRWLPTVPKDLWDQSIAYRFIGSTPVIYSFGPDGKDDAGLPLEANRLSPGSRGDLVYGHLYRRRQRR